MHYIAELGKYEQQILQGSLIFRRGAVSASKWPILCQVEIQLLLCWFVSIFKTLQPLYVVLLAKESHDYNKSRRTHRHFIFTCNLFLWHSIDWFMHSDINAIYSCLQNTSWLYEKHFRTRSAEKVKIFYTNTYTKFIFILGYLKFRAQN